MAIDSVSKLATYIGNRVKDQDDIDSNIAPEDGEFVNTLKSEEDLVINGNVVGYKLIYDENAFILNHPIQGELDSAVYELDSGYRNPTEIHFPLTFPIYWDQGYKERLFVQPLIEA